MPTISLQLPDEILEALNRAAQLRRVTRSTIVRETLERALCHSRRRGKPSCYDLASDLAGSVKGLPKDIATNPEYLRGLGE